MARMFEYVPETDSPRKIIDIAAGFHNDLVDAVLRAQDELQKAGLAHTETYKLNQHILSRLKAAGGAIE